MRRRILRATAAGLRCHLHMIRPVAASGRGALSTVSGRGFATATDMSVFDEEQVKMMEEMCILLDRDDNVIGRDTKKNVHLIDGPCMKAGGVPHRAFSAFVFNQKNELLLQQRCDQKILFPDHWANTCCSHPLHDGALFLGSEINGEMDGALGTIRAARRKLLQELGVPPEQLPESCFQFVTRVHYKAAMPGSDPMWGEHEIDYLLIARPEKDITYELNPGEVSEAKYFSQQELRDFVASGSHNPGAGPGAPLISPWFLHIEGTLLHGWWDNLGAVVEDDLIHRCSDDAV